MRRRDPQLALALRSPCRWGGKRDGAGRKAGADPRIRHRSREGFGRTLPAHVTLRLVADVPSLRTVSIVHEIKQTFARGCERPGFRLVHYSLQGNHAHLIVEAHDQMALGRGMMAIGSRLAKAVNRMAERSGSVLADRYHFRLLRTPKEVRNALRYVLLNAQRHAVKGIARVAAKARAGRTVRVMLDPASSARWFDGWKLGGGEVPSAGQPAARPAPSPVARARTWLLSMGWRRYGLLDPADVPG